MKDTNNFPAGRELMLLKYLETTSPATRQSARPSVSTRADAAARILIVDDDPDIRRNYSEVLIRAGYRVDSAPDLAASWSLVDAWRHGAQGYNLLITNNLAQTSDPQQAIPPHFIPMTLLVVLSLQAGPEHVERIQLAAILARPFDPRRLPERVGTILHNTQGANLR